jgi:hypothetical protein
MQQLGQLMNPRDERGWMIPRPGTKRRQIYDAMVAGDRPLKIMWDMGFMPRGTFNNHRYAITKPDKSNAIKYAGKLRSMEADE